jgi:hypothetical protein
MTDHNLLATTRDSEATSRDSEATTGDREKHLGDRPTWICRACGEPWPCAGARRDLRIEFRWFPSVFKIYMMGQMADAAADLEPDSTGPSAALYDRFLSWLPIPAQRRPTC